MQAYRTLLTGLLQRAQAARLLAPGTDLQAAAVLFIGSVQGLVMQSLLSGQVAGMAAQAPQVYRIFHNGVAARTAPPDPSPEGSP
ncbi:hypothetical protein D3C72_2401100 [compost metagenome]